MTPLGVARATAMFFRERFPATYVLYAVLWSSAATSAARSLAGFGVDAASAGRFAAQTVALLAALIALRLLDDLKDLPGDRAAHPGRPLPSGRASPAEYGVAAGVFGAAGLILAFASAGVVGAATLALVLAYGLALWPLGHVIPHLERRPLLEMALTYPVQILATVFLLASTYQRLEPGAAGPQVIWLFVFFAGAFLQLEIARKSASAEKSAAGDYSRTLGVRGAAALSAAFSVLAVFGAVILAHPWDSTPVFNVAGWLLPLTLIIPFDSLWNYARGDRDRPSAASSALFLVLLYLCVSLLVLIG